MAEIQPIRALRYDLDRTGGLQDVVAPPYDVIDDAQRAALEARSPYNVVRIDLPEGGEDRYDRAAALLDEWRAEGAWSLDERARAVDAVSGLHRARRPAAHAPRPLRARARGGVRRPAASARTSAPTPARARTGCG